jgi:Flp pilus assembly protein TadB
MLINFKRNPKLWIVLPILLSLFFGALILVLLLVFNVFFVFLIVPIGGFIWSLVARLAARRKQKQAQKQRDRSQGIVDYEKYEVHEEKQPEQEESGSEE